MFNLIILFDASVCSPRELKLSNAAAAILLAKLFFVIPTGIVVSIKKFFYPISHLTIETDGMPILCDHESFRLIMFEI